MSLKEGYYWTLKTPSSPWQPALYNPKIEKWQLIGLGGWHATEKLHQIGSRVGFKLEEGGKK